MEVGLAIAKARRLRTFIVGSSKSTPTERHIYLIETSGHLRHYQDPDIFVELEDGIFYQMSYDGTDVPIIADYPGLLPASHVSNPEIPCQESFLNPPYPSHCPVVKKGRRSAGHAAPGASPKRASPTPGKPTKRKANKDTVEPSSKRYEFANMHLGSHIQL